MKRFLGILLFCTMFLSTVVFANGSTASTNIDGLRISGVYTDEGVTGYQVTYATGSVENIGSDSILIFINGSIVERAGAVIENDRLLVPLRVVGETLNAKVDWKEEPQTVTVTEGETLIELTIGESAGQLNGKDFVLDAPPKLISGSTYVPLRFVSEGLGAKVDYADGIDQSVPYLIDGFTQVMISKTTSDMTEIGRERAIELLYEDLVYAYEKRFGIDFEPIDEQPQSAVYAGDEEYFRYTFSHLAVKAETDRYYIISVVFDFWVDKYTGELYVYYNGSSKTVNKFNKESESALAFAG